MQVGETRIEEICEVGVDSGMLMIGDPSYLMNFSKIEDKKYDDHAHTVYRHKDDGSLWQFTYGKKSSVEKVNVFPGTYGDVIPRYKKTPNQLREEGLFIETDIDPRPHINTDEFSYRAVSKLLEKFHTPVPYVMTNCAAFRSGLGDGGYKVFAEIVQTKSYGERVKKVWVELLTEEDITASYKDDE
jgi:hypothetical protein